MNLKKQIIHFWEKNSRDRRKKRRLIRYLSLVILLFTVWMVQTVPTLGEGYARHFYPVLSFVLSGLSGPIPFSIGELFVFIAIVLVIAYPIYAAFKKRSWKTIVRREVEGLLWIYVWFYIAWGLNYWQKDFYHRNRIDYIAYDETSFRAFLDDYIIRLNRSYTKVTAIDQPLIEAECIRLYDQLSDSLGVHRPPHQSLNVKTMLFTPFISKVGVTGSMAPFFCEFTVNGDLLPSEYPATYAHELSHLLGITSEAEANFYAYQICTRSTVGGIRFSGYYSILHHVLGNAARLLPKSDYERAVNRIRPEIISLAEESHRYWMSKYSPTIGRLQGWIYDLYLKRNQIESGRKNYSEVVSLLIAYQQHLNEIVDNDKPNRPTIGQANDRSD